MITLRDYQDAAIAKVRQSFANGRHSPLLVMPTGAGKTVTFSYLTQRITASGKRVVLLCHREELVDQISETLRRFSVQHGFITASTYYDRRYMAHVASVMTLKSRIDRILVPDYVIIDEAHHCIAASTWGKVITQWRQANPALRLVGVTATPERLSGEGLGEVFDDMVIGPSVRELIDRGALCDYRLFAPAKAVDLSGVHSRMGDFVRGEVEAAMDKPTITGDAVAHYRKHCDGAPAVAFCVSLKHADHVAESFRSQGYRAACIDGKMDKGLRRSLVQDFGRGAINVLVSVDVISEGFDCPGIVGAICLRPTQSLSLYLQQVGRALRTADGKVRAVLLDHVGNSMRHGLPDDERDWSLAGRGDERRKKKDNADNPAIRQCQKCYAVNPTSALACIECKAVFAVKPRMVEQVDGTLSEIEVERIKREAKQAQGKSKTLEDLKALAAIRGYSPKWAEHVFNARNRKRGVTV